MINYILSGVTGYLIGSVSISIILTKYIFKDDVRSHGSGNAGATNVARTFGWGPGIITFLCDFAKCVIAMQIGRSLGGDWGYTIAGISCLIGHCFPVYFGFRGGKAVSTTACVAFLIDWRIFLVALAAFFLVAFLTKIVSISSVIAATVIMIMTLVLSLELYETVLGVFAGVLVIIMHIPNIRRLLRKEEKAFRPGKRKQD